MSNAITAYVNATLDEKRAYVQTLASAGDLLPKGLWANVKNPDTGMMENRPSPGKVMLIVETGLMLGLHPMAALQGIDVIEGNPTLKPALMSALIRQAGHVLRIEQTGTIEGGDFAVTTTGIRSDDPDHPYVYTWTPHDAVRAELIDSYAPDQATGKWKVKASDKNGNSKPWQKWTARMCRWRSLGDVASAGFEDVLMGLHYTPEELGAEVNSEGEMISLPAAAPEPSEDWSAAILACSTKDELLAVKQRAVGEWSDNLNTELLTRAGMFSRGEIAAPIATPDVEGEAPERDPAEPTPEEYAAADADQAVQS